MNQSTEYKGGREGSIESQQKFDFFSYDGMPYWMFLLKYFFPLLPCCTWDLAIGRWEVERSEPKLPLNKEPVFSSLHMLTPNQQIHILS